MTVYSTHQIILSHLLEVVAAAHPAIPLVSLLFVHHCIILQVYITCTDENSFSPKLIINISLTSA